MFAENLSFQDNDFEGREILKLISLKWLQLHLNHPLWLEKILHLTCLNWLKLHQNDPPWLEKILKFTDLKCLKLTCSEKI